MYRRGMEMGLKLGLAYALATCTYPVGGDCRSSWVGRLELQLTLALGFFGWSKRYHAKGGLSENNQYSALAPTSDVFVSIHVL